MAIDRIPLINLAPMLTQRLDMSNVTALAPASVAALAQLAAYTPELPAAGAGVPAHGQQAFGGAPAAGAGADATPHDTSAMQVNQLFFSRQLVWQAPNPATLAASWRVMVRTYGEQRAALQEQARGQHVPGNLFMAEQNPAALREAARPPLIMDAEAWRFAVYGWAGQRLMLRVLAGDPDEDDAPKRRHGKVALRLELVLADLGRVMIQMEAMADGILLELAAPDPAAQQLLRRMLPELVEAIGRSGLRILRCRIGRELQSARVHNNYPMQAAAASLSLPVFRAMAEVALLLSREAAAPDYAALEQDADTVLQQQREAEPAPPPEPLTLMVEQSLPRQEAPALEPDLAPDLLLEAELEAEIEASMQLELDLGLPPPPPRRAADDQAAGV
ncbi:hypothetical protein ACFDR9_003482 [Janthinobacterium sp. CG_23.3]|uniref:hypothetical protein n=1 Tax=Janthinobacterium sp. CG_23.3 TaxID=3349634 RepID=UPI0038D365B3